MLEFAQTMTRAEAATIGRNTEGFAHSRRWYALGESNPSYQIENLGS